MAAARARSPGSGRNDRMCAAQKAWLAVTDAEEREPVVAGGVLVALLGLLGVVDGPGGGVAAGGPAGRGDRVVPARVVAHVLQVRGPAAPGGGQLVAERRDRRRVDAALAEDLVVRPGDDLAGERYPDRAVDLGAQVRGLPGDLRDVVGRAAVADRVVVLQQGPHPRQRPGQVRIGGRGAEALRVPLVLQLDHPHVPDRPQAARCRGAGPGRRAGRAGPGARAAGRARARGEDQREYRGGEQPPPALHPQHACLQLRDSEPRWWRARPRPGSFPARRGPASCRCGAARCPGRASRSRRSG